MGAGHGKKWPDMDVPSRPWQAMACNGRPWQAIAGHGQAWLGMASHDQALSVMTSHGWRRVMALSPDLVSHWRTRDVYSRLEHKSCLMSWLRHRIKQWDCLISWPHMGPRPHMPQARYETQSSAPQRPRVPGPPTPGPWALGRQTFR